MTFCTTNTTTAGVGRETAIEGLPPVAGTASEATNGNAAAQTLETPTTARGLLVNLKAGLEQGLFLRSEFYTDDNLVRFFGTPRVEWLVNTDTNRYGKLRGPDYLPARGDFRSVIFVTRSLIDAENRLSAKGKIYAAVGILCSCQLRIEDIEGVFGTGRRTVTDERERERMLLPGDMALPPPATDPMGNKRVTYEIQTPLGYRSTFSVVLDPYGHVNGIEAKQGE
jgi:hypothetical protein